MTTTTRTTAAAVTLVMLITGLGVTGCSEGGRDITSGPSVTSAERGTHDGAEAATPATPATAVLARTAQQPIRSGRVDVQAGPVTMATAFDGDDLRVRTTAEGHPSGTTSGSGGVELLLVGGQAYAQIGNDVVRVPFGSSALSSSAGTSISDTIGAVRNLLEKATVDDPGTPATVDGVAVTRYRAELTGTGVADLLDGTGAWRSKVPGDEATRRSVDDALNRARVSLVGDIDGEGMLRHLVITVTPDASASADCSLLRFLPTTTITLSGIDQPQGITAPPADQVKDLTELDPTQLFDDFAKGFSIDGATPPVPSTSLPGGVPDCPR